MNIRNILLLILCVSLLSACEPKQMSFNITELKLCKGATPPAHLYEDCKLDRNANDFYAVKSDGSVKIPDEDSGKIEWSYDDAIKTFVRKDQITLPKI